MRIKEIISQHRRDFKAMFQCEHCGVEYELHGYDDANFHQNVIPSFECRKCGKRAPDNYRPLTTKYPEGYQV
jgi:transcription elongation factor Elf1